MKTSELILFPAVVVAIAAGVMLFIALMATATGEKDLVTLFLPPLWAGASAAGLWIMAMVIRLLERIADGIEKIQGDSQKEKPRP